MEPTILLKKRGMCRNERLRDAEENPGLINRRSLSVFVLSMSPLMVS